MSVWVWGTSIPYDSGLGQHNLPCPFGVGRLQEIRSLRLSGYRISIQRTRPTFDDNTIRCVEREAFRGSLRLKVGKISSKWMPQIEKKFKVCDDAIANRMLFKKQGILLSCCFACPPVVFVGSVGFSACGWFSLWIAAPACEVGSRFFPTQRAVLFMGQKFAIRT